MQNSLFFANTAGFLVSYYGHDSLIRNCTIADNSEWDVHFHPSYTTSQLTILNSILRGRVRGDQDTPVILEYCNIQPDGIDKYVVVTASCQSTSPRFVAPAQDDYRLAADSPCIDAGCPNAFHNDWDGTRNDLGHTGGSDLLV